MKTNLCNNCGMCCMHVNIPPFYGPGDPTYKSCPPKLLKEIEDYLNSPRYIDAEHPCLWLNRSTGECKNYQYRPEICRDYQVGEISCRLLRTQVGLTLDGLPLISNYND
jgi:Fe-S-cluster containining protein